MITIHRHIKYILFFAIGFFIGGVALAHGAVLDSNGNIINTPEYGVFRNSVDESSILVSNQYNTNTSVALWEQAISMSLLDTVWINVVGLSNCDSLTRTQCLALASDFTVWNGLPPPTQSIAFVDTNDVSTADMVASVRGGVASTTDGALPIAVLVGIPIAFLILVMVIMMIQDTQKYEKRKRKILKKVTR